MAWPKGRPRSPETIEKIRTHYRVDERYWEHVDKRGEDECWPWTGYVNRDGYGRIGKRRTGAHRLAWQYAYGEIPDGYVVDHRCHTEDATCAGGRTCAHRRCQNPRHLQLVTNVVNVMSGHGVGALNADKTHCDAGHLFDEANTYVRPDGRGRDCRKCRAEAAARSRRKKAQDLSG